VKNEVSFYKDKWGLLFQNTTLQRFMLGQESIFQPHEEDTYDEYGNACETTEIGTFSDGVPLYRAPHPR